ncbi:MAG: hypothetical protein RJA57_1462 [Bacteroidota bacterium]|jgi:HSP20 family protein
MRTHHALRSSSEKRLSDLVEDFFNGWPRVHASGINEPLTKDQVPTNVYKTATGYQIELIVPGFDKSDIRVTAENGLLTVTGEHSNKTHENDDRVRTEYRFRSFKKSFTIDDRIDATCTEASYVNGVLALNLPLRAEVKSQATTIEIR